MLVVQLFQLPLLLTDFLLIQLLPESVLNRNVLIGTFTPITHREIAAHQSDPDCPLPGFAGQTGFSWTWFGSSSGVVRLLV